MNNKTSTTAKLLAALFITAVTVVWNVNAAYAAVPVRETNPDLLRNTRKIANNTKNILKEMKEEWKKNVEQEKTKIGILRYLQQNIANYVTGGSSTDSKPRFITNWETYQNESFEQGKQTAIRDLESSGFLASGNEVDQLIIARLNGEPSTPSSDKSSSDTQKSQTKSEPLPSPVGGGQNQEFNYNSYLNSWLPENNYYGKYMIAQDIVETKAAARAEAAKNEAIASSGFLGVKEGCDQLGANCNITLPGKSVGDILAGALNSEIDYAANAGEGAAQKALAENYGIPTAPAEPPLVTDIISQQEGGLTGVVQSRTPNSSNGQLSGVNSPGGIENRELPDGGIIPIPDANQSADATVDDLLNQFIQDIMNQAETTVTDIINGLDDSSDYDSLEYESSTYRDNKIASYIEVQKTIWYLDDLKTALETWDNRPLYISRYSATDCTAGNDNCYLITGLSQARTSLITSINNIEQRLQSILNNLNGEIISTSSNNSDSTALASSAAQRESLYDLYLAGLTVSDPPSENFDLNNVLPINLLSGEADTCLIEKTTAAYISVSLTPGCYSPRAIFRYIYSSSGNITSSYSSIFKFFQNELRYRYNSTITGSGNYLGLTLNPPSPSLSWKFYLHKNRIEPYLSSLSSRLDNLNDDILLLSDSGALNRKIAYRESQEAVARESYKASRYIEGVLNSFVLDIFNLSRTTEINEYKRSLSNTSVSAAGNAWLVNIDNNLLSSAQNKRDVFNQLFLAGITTPGNNSFDLLNKLPINTSSNSAPADNGAVEIPVEINPASPIKQSVAPFSSSQNFLGLPVNTVFWLHLNNLPSYLNAIRDKISQLQTAGFLSP